MSSIIKLPDCNPEWSEMQGDYQVTDVPVWFIYISLPYNNESITHSFTLSLNLSETPEMKVEMTKNNKGYSVTENTYVKEG